MIARTRTACSHEANGLCRTHEKLAMMVPHRTKHLYMFSRNLAGEACQVGAQMGGAGCAARRAAVWALAVTVMRRPVVRLELPGFLHASPDWALADLRWYARRAHLEFATGLGGLGFDDRVMTCVLGSERDSRGGKKRSCLGTHVASSE